MNTKPWLSTMATAAALAFTGASTFAAPPTAAEVGDADSFGSRVVWLGMTGTGIVSLRDDCTPDPNNPPRPEDRCVVLNPSPTPTGFAFSDLGRITLPAHSTNSLICHWATPSVFYSWTNPGAVPMAVEFRVRPFYRIESAVLQDPSLINPLTGLPFGGGIDVTVSGVADRETALPGSSQVRQVTSTRTCIAGLVSKAQLTRDYGLSDTLVKRFFQGPITIRAGVIGSARGLSEASVQYSTRLTGDHR